jgi:hypothetical protein
MLDVAIAILLGTIYGYMKPGKEDRIALFRKALKIGLIIGIGVGVLGALLTPGLLSIAVFGAGIVTVLFIVISFAILFIIGTFIGDYLEGLKS